MSTSFLKLPEFIKWTLSLSRLWRMADKWEGWWESHPECVILNRAQTFEEEQSNQMLFLGKDVHVVGL